LDVVDNKVARRRFLQFVASSPYVAALGGVRVLAQRAPEIAAVMADPKEALSVMDFEEAARPKVAPQHWAFMASGVDDDATLRANREGYGHIKLRPRRLRDATKVDMRTALCGATYKSPIYLCPTGSNRAFHPDGEFAVARAAKARGTMMMLSTASNTGVEDVCKAFGAPVWAQLTAPTSWAVFEKILRRVENAGCPVIVLTVDYITGRNAETQLRAMPKDRRPCLSCHEGGEIPSLRARRLYDGIDMTGVGLRDPSTTWEVVDRLRKATSHKLFIKGIETHEDARLCLEHGIDGIVVSNHGGRATETGRSTIEALPEVVPAVGNRIPVFLDGGVRRGTDVFKALALGAKAVGIGRPYLWGMGAFGEAGVDRVLEILQGELKLVMGNCGTQSVSDIDHNYII
jgi:isopentenyl diphosphate isomerase/L-lactate dehydrogenase-like FMN-dependent dehydrogenase